MLIDRLRYEWQLMGKKVVLVPLLIMLGFGLFALLLHYMHVDSDRFLSGGLEMILPLAAGAMVAAVVSYDPAVELQLTMPTHYRRTAIQRMLLILLWSSCVALLASSIISALRLGYTTELIGSTLPSFLQFLIGQLSWCAALLWCIGFGLCLALFAHSATASVAILSGIWMLEIFFKDLVITISWLKPVILFPTTLYGLTLVSHNVYFDWLINRYEVLGTGLLLLLLGYYLLRSTEGLLKGASEE
ncbi:hypothetical protein EPA93_46590 [Ktedonosporobacter rubrisoli]|uniref:Uncharacterized protein n=1 Tax=Ktedonosporobacter rubrisoli TaxID=2509675 RepID=A0A4P6K494_KTERU|nr:hypothetical protein [Ktedonosporobacter rubrisoli]QBD83039.1 hypothetical protein EPA93_46590 [Ktedonosporobacter rubrisoli]